MSETTKSATSFDVAIGYKIRLGRSLSGLSQTELATRIGVSFQQVQKYEKGANRVAAHRLCRIANAVGQPLDWFFGDKDASAIEAPSPMDSRAAETLASKEGVLLLATFARIRSPEVRRRVLALVISVAETTHLDG